MFIEDAGGGVVLTLKGSHVYKPWKDEEERESEG